MYGEAIEGAFKALIVFCVFVGILIAILGYAVIKLLLYVLSHLHWA